MKGKRNKTYEEPFRVPYSGALKAYAYGGVPFQAALDALGQFGFPTPVPRSIKYKDMNRVHDEMFNEGKLLRNSARLNSKKARELGIYPMYDWVMAVEGERSHEVDLLDSVVYNINCMPLRRMVSVLSFQTIANSAIVDIMMTDWRAPAIKWGLEQIEVYRNFFWNTRGMSNNNWNKYLKITPKDNDDYSFVYAITKGRSGLTWHGAAPTDVDILTILRSIFAEQSQEYMNNRNSRAGAEAIRTAQAITNIQSIRGSESDEGTNPLKDVELVITRERRRQYKMEEEFMDVAELDKNMNDPKDFTVTSEEYFENVK